MVTFDFKRTGPGLQRIIDGLPGAAERGVRRALDDTAKLAIRMAPNVVGKCIKVEMLNSETGEIVVLRHTWNLEQASKWMTRATRRPYASSVPSKFHGLSM